jgi:glycosyltransferase involved in cell wall biosynthesis
VKRPLVVINGPILQDGARRLITRHTGRMLSEVAGKLGPLELWQFLVPRQDARTAGGLFDFDLSLHPLLAAGGVPSPAGSGWKRLVPRLHMYAGLPAKVAHRPWCYLFLPGTLPAACAAACRLRGVPYAVYLRGLAPDDWLHAQALGHARLVVCNNTHDAGRASRHARPVVIARALTELDGGDLERPRDFRPRPRRLLFVGRLEKPKGVDVLLTVFNRLRRDDPDLELVLVGDGPLAPEAEAMDGTCGGIRLTGTLHDRDSLAREYLQADLFILPSLAEGFPRVLYEAMIFRLPIVTTMVGGIPSVMEDGRNCLAVAPGSPESLETAIRRLLWDSALRATLVEGGMGTMRAWLECRLPSHADHLLQAFPPMGRRS